MTIKPETVTSEGVAALLQKVRHALGELDEVQENLNRRAARLDAQAEDITGRLRAEGIDTPEAIARIYACLDDETKAAAAARVAQESAAAAAGEGGRPKPRRVGRMV